MSDTVFVDLSNIYKTNHRLLESLFPSFPTTDLRLPALLLTLRQCLSILNSIYDPLGLLAPLTICLKVAFRNLFLSGLNLKWDDPIPAEDDNIWMRLIQMLNEAEKISFTVPQNLTRPSANVK